MSGSVSLSSVLLISHYDRLSTEDQRCYSLSLCLLFVQEEELSMSDLLFNGVFPKWNRAFIEFSEFSEIREFDKSLKHELGSLKDLVSHMCLAGAVVAPWSFNDNPH